MAFRDWLNPQAAIVAISAIDDKETPHKIPTIATIATIAEVESTKQLAANDQETQKESDADWHEFLYGKSTEELLYNHLLTCNQCEHLALTGTCSRLGKRVNPQALRECGSFKLLKKERPQIEEVKPYSQDELHRLFNQAARPLYHHLIDCEQCSLEDMRYCVDCFTTGNTFDCLLLCFDDAANKRYELMNQVIKARISGHRVYMGAWVSSTPNYF